MYSTITAANRINLILSYLLVFAELGPASVGWFDELSEQQVADADITRNNITSIEETQNTSGEVTDVAEEDSLGDLDLEDVSGNRHGKRTNTDNAYDGAEHDGCYHSNKRGLPDGPQGEEDSGNVKNRHSNRQNDDWNESQGSADCDCHSNQTTGHHGFTDFRMPVPWPDTHKQRALEVVLSPTLVSPSVISQTGKPNGSSTPQPGHEQG